MDISEWDVLLDRSGQVIRIGWCIGSERAEGGMAGGSIDFKWLPETLEGISLVGYHLHGTIDTHVLPRGLRFMHLSRNRLNGTFDVSGLPRSIQKISVTGNALEGSIKFAEIPQNVEVLDLSYNLFSGVHDLSVLPVSLTNLRLERNCFVIPEVLVVPSTKLSVCTLNRGKLKEVRDTDGRMHRVEEYGRKSIIRVVWVDSEEIEKYNI